MTYADFLRQEGRQEGEQEGEQKARQQIAVEFLKAGDSANKVAKCTHLPLDEVKKLQKMISH